LANTIASALERLVTPTPLSTPASTNAASQALAAQQTAVNEAQQAYFENLLTSRSNEFAQQLALQQGALDNLTQRLEMSRPNKHLNNKPGFIVKP
jgi:hypothetical protein